MGKLFQLNYSTLLSTLKEAKIIVACEKKTLQSHRGVQVSVKDTGFVHISSFAKFSPLLLAALDQL